MRKLKSRPSPALVVAAVALVAALGGTAVAASQINGHLLKPKTVGGGKLKKDTLGGFQVDEDRLGAVPSAKSVVGDSRYSVKLGFGQAQELASAGPLKLTGHCVQNTTDTEGRPGRDVARILVSTSENNSVFDGVAGSKAGGASGFLNPTTPDGERIAIEYSVPTGADSYISGGRLSALAPSGAGISLPAGGNGAALNMFGTACVLHGAAFQA